MNIYFSSEAGSDDQSNVGWTYYNKVMVMSIHFSELIISSQTSLFKHSFKHSRFITKFKLPLTGYLP